MEPNNIINSFFSEENIEIEDEIESDEAKEDVIDYENIKEINNET